jgi:hypothetical protein
MIRQFEKPEEDIIFNGAELPGLLRLTEARADLVGASVSGRVPGSGEDLIAAGGPFSAGSTAVSEKEYVELSGPEHAYKAYRNGRVKPMGEAPPARKNPRVGAFLRANRWPYPYQSGGDVSVSSAKTETQASVTAEYHVASSEVKAPLSTESVRSDAALVVFGAAKGSGTVSAALTTGSGDQKTTWASGDQPVSGSGWSPWRVVLAPSGRIGYRAEGPNLEIDPGGTSMVARPVVTRKRHGFAGGVVPLPDGTAFVHVTSGRGTSEDGQPLVLQSPTAFRASLSAGRLAVYATRFASGSKERAIYAGRDRSQSRLVERAYKTRIWASPTPPERGRALLFRHVAESNG